MKKLSKVTILFLVIFASCKTSVKMPKTQDVVKARLHSIFFWKNPITDVTDYYNDVWVKDSFLIFKCNQVRLIDNTDTARKRATLETRSFSFINLRNYNCQDYLEFNDTASAISNYSVGINDTTLNYLFELNRYPVRGNKLAKYSRISDTIENAVKYKRYQTFKTYADGFMVRSVAFVGSENYPPYFHDKISTTIDLDKNEFVIKKSDFNNGTELSNIIIENLTKQLTPYDEKVFAKWKENSEHPKLPLITATEASKILSDTLFQIDIKRFSKFSSPE